MAAVWCGCCRGSQGSGHSVTLCGKRAAAGTGSMAAVTVLTKQFLIILRDSRSMLIIKAVSLEREFTERGKKNIEHRSISCFVLFRTMGDSVKDILKSFSA